MQGNFLIPLFNTYIVDKVQCIYWFKCDRIDCEDEYIGESYRTFEERYKEHLKTPSHIFEQQNNSGHITSVEIFKIICREGHNRARTIKEAIYIWVNNPTQNKEYWKIQPATPLG